MLNLNDILLRAKDLKIAVIGDLIEDIYLYGDVDRISPEAPVPVVKYTHTKRTMGGAGNVFMNIINLCPQTDLYCFFNGPNWWPNSDRIFTHQYPHAKKTRVMHNQHHMLRIDEEAGPGDIEWLPFKSVEWWRDFEINLFEKKYDVIVLSDYGKGVLSDSVINGIMELAINYKYPVVVDAKKDFNRFAGADIMKCNNKEWGQVDGDIQKNIISTGIIKNVIVTQGEIGITFSSHSPFEVGKSPGIKVAITDVCGAGDTVTAISAIMLALGEPLSDACDLSNIAAAEVCKYSGVTPIDEDKLISAFNDYNK